jgi:hypothetical protein
MLASPERPKMEEIPGTQISYGNFFIHAVRGEPYIKHRDEIVDEVSALKVEVYKGVFKDKPYLMREHVERDILKIDSKYEKDPEEDIPKEVVDDIERRATVLLAAPKSNPRKLVGVLTAREAAIPVYDNSGRDRVLDVLLTTRAVLAEYRDQDLGTGLSEIGRSFHSVDMNAIRSRSAIAIYTAIKAGVLSRNAFGLFRPYSEDSVAQQVLWGLHPRMSRNATCYTPDSKWGVARRLYRGEDLAEYPHPNHGPTMEIQDILIHDRKMNLERDALYIVDYAR